MDPLLTLQKYNKHEKYKRIKRTDSNETTTYNMKFS